MHRHFRFALLTAAIASTFIPAFAQALTGITAEEAFDAVQTQTDPITGADAKVALVDVRTRAEYYWVGAPTKVKQIVLKDTTALPIVPDLGKVKLVNRTGFLEYSLLEYTVDGRHKWTPISKVAKLDTSPIAINIPYKLWDESTAKTSLNPDFNAKIAELASPGNVDVLIVFCRSGSRSSTCGTQIEGAALFDAVYEIDDPTPNSTGGVGGFEGSPYSEVYNGYHGFPGRLTGVQTVPSVSWKDTGLPIRIGVDPFAPLP
jgi:rhodanese-related sulfurtransferase